MSFLARMLLMSVLVVAGLELGLDIPVVSAILDAANTMVVQPFLDWLAQEVVDRINPLWVGGLP